MPTIDIESHFKFLLTCIKHSSAGRVNFQAVAEELEIVTKAAAAKRYERLLKAHDSTPAPAPATPKKGENGEGTAKTPRSRKRKTPAKVEKDEDDDSFKGESGEEKKPVVKREKRVKTEGVKEEDGNPDTVSALQEGGFNAMRGKKVKMCDIPWATEEVLAAARRGGSGNEAITVDDDDDEVLIVGSSSLSELRGDEGSGDVPHATAATAAPLPTLMVASADQNHGDAAAFVPRKTVLGVGANEGFAIQSQRMRLPLERSLSHFPGGPPFMGSYHGA